MRLFWTIVQQASSAAFEAKEAIEAKEASQTFAPEIRKTRNQDDRVLEVSGGCCFIDLYKWSCPSVRRSRAILKRRKTSCSDDNRFLRISKYDWRTEGRTHKPSNRDARKNLNQLQRTHPPLPLSFLLHTHPSLSLSLNPRGARVLNSHSFHLFYVLQCLFFSFFLLSFFFFLFSS